jgi:hypothetical protein
MDKQLSNFAFKLNLRRYTGDRVLRQGRVLQVVPGFGLRFVSPFEAKM